MKLSRMLVFLVIVVSIGSSCAFPTTQATRESGGVDSGQEPPASVQDSPTPIPSPSPTPEPLAALVNGQTITLAEFERQVERYKASMVAAGQDPSTPEGQKALTEGRQWVLDLMIDQVLIEQAAAHQGVTVSPEEVDQTLSALRDEIGDETFNDWLEREGMTLDEMRAKLRADLLATKMANLIAEQVPTHAEHVHARHILVGTEEEARRLLGQLQAGAEFAALARKYSQDSSTRDLGGDLGVFPRGVLTSKEVEAAAFSLQPGQVSDVIPSELGYHIVQVVERIPDQEISPDTLRFLRDQAVRQWLEELRASADIQVFVHP